MDYDKGKESVRGMSSNKLKHAIFCLPIGMAVEEIDKGVRGKAGGGSFPGRRHFFSPLPQQPSSPHSAINDGRQAVDGQFEARVFT